MVKFKVTNVIDWVEGTVIIRNYENLYDCTIDGAVPQDWFDANYDEIVRRGGAYWVYREGDILGNPMFYDELVDGFGLHLKKERCDED